MQSQDTDEEGVTRYTVQLSDGKTLMQSQDTDEEGVTRYTVRLSDGKTLNLNTACLIPIHEYIQSELDSASKVLYAASPFNMATKEEGTYFTAAEKEAHSKATAEVAAAAKTVNAAAEEEAKAEAEAKAEEEKNAKAEADAKVSAIFFS